MELRPYQQRIIEEIHTAWSQGARNVCVQLATGGGKTVIFSEVIREACDPAIAIAHRQELVGQISLTLARNGVRHNLIAARPTITEIVRSHMRELGRNYYDPQARHVVAGVDTLVRLDPDTAWFKTIRLVVQDESHHVLADNKWGRAAAFFPHARGLYPTATPLRADGKGLGRHADGIMDTIIEGVGMRDLIQDGYLTEYRIFAPPASLDLASVAIGSTGDYAQPGLRRAVHKAQITGDVVAHYQRIAAGKLGVTFAVDVAAATEIAMAYREAGIPAEAVSATTPDSLRADIIARFRRREVLQLVNVDLFGEGFDLPAIEVVSMVRPTRSFALYSQCFGRALRPMPGKKYAIIIDHVGNVMRNGLPDRPIAWSLDRRDRRTRGAADDALPLRTCLNIRCLAVYSRARRVCPYCSTAVEPSGRSSPEEVDGDLLELSPQTLAALRGEIARVDNAPRIPQGATDLVQASIHKMHRARQQAQGRLRQEIAQWAGWRRQEGLDDHTIYRLFYLRFKVDVLSAQSLGASEADALVEKIIAQMSEGDID